MFKNRIEKRIKMVVVSRPSHAGKELSTSFVMPFTFLIFGLFVVDITQTVLASPGPKKLTNEEVLKELGVEIKMKGKDSIVSLEHVNVRSIHHNAIIFF